MSAFNLNRRDFLKLTASTAGASVLGSIQSRAQVKARPAFRLATFKADVTVPLGHALMGGGIAPAREVVDPLYAHGFVLLGGGDPVVVVSVDWCEIRNDAFDAWREALAEAAGTTPQRVLVSSVHVHDAPVADLEAQRLLETAQATGSICDIQFHARAVRNVAEAVRSGLRQARRVTQIGLGRAKVEKLASNRRYFDATGKPVHNRMSATRDPKIRERPEGTIDPWLKTLSFWDGERPVAALSCYSTHPMSYYGKGGVSADFVGVARQRRQQDDARVFQIYASGCSGNVTAGKYNDGAPENRAVLADRLYQGLAAAWKDTQRLPLETLRWRSVPLRLEPRNSPEFTVAGLTKTLENRGARPFDHCLAALGLSWRKRADAGHRLDVPVLDFGPAQLLLLPAEAYVEFQLHAQQARPDSFVAVMGYGECAPGYIPIERAWQEGDTNLRDWCWVAPGAEAAMKQAITAALKG